MAGLAQFLGLSLAVPGWWASLAWSTWSMLPLMVDAKWLKPTRLYVYFLYYTLVRRYHIPNDIALSALQRAFGGQPPNGGHLTLSHWVSRGTLNLSCKFNMAAWPVPGHETCLSNKCLTKRTSIFSLYQVSGTLKLTKIGLSAWPLYELELQIYWAWW